ncbi:MAG TPA: response regulator [Pilimelia sp.]|nr:response regulator [Pilimelia sp.]
MSGHEPRFRQLFLEEAGPSLDRLSRDLLALEHVGTDPALVNSLFREAHNLKGGAGVVGLDEVRRLAHAMEDVLEPLRDGRSLATAEVVDRLLAAVDGVRVVLPALVTGAPHGVDVDRLEALLRGGALPPSPSPPSPSPPQPPTTGPPAAGGPASGGPARGGQATAGPATGTATLPMPVARLDEIARLVGEGAGAHSRLGRYLNDRLDTEAAEVAEFRELAALLNDLQERTTRARMVPIAALADPLHRVVRDLSRKLGKQVRWEVSGAETELDRSLIDQLTGPLLHLVRNAVDHGVEAPDERTAAGKPAQATVRLHAMQIGSEVVMTVVDDGRGIDVDRVRGAAGDPSLSDEEAIYLVFRSGLSTAETVSEVSGRGVGLDVVRTNLEAVRGHIKVRSATGRGTEFRITVPVTLTVLRCLIVGAGGQRYALPLHMVVTVLPPSATDEVADGRAIVRVGDQAVPVGALAETLAPGAPAEAGPAVVLAGLTRQRAFRVAALLGQRDVVVKELSPLLPRLPILTGVSAEPDGTVLLVLDANGLIDLARGRHAPGRQAPPAGRAPARIDGSILVVDDVLTVRELQRSILERAGYTVHVAADGEEALTLAESVPLDLVLTDVEMPRMDGFELTRRLRAHPRLGGVGIVVLTSLGTDEDRRRGMEAGADGYIVKSQFDERALLAAVQQTLGEPA